MIFFLKRQLRYLIVGLLLSACGHQGTKNSAAVPLSLPASITKNVVYKTVGPTKLRLDIYVPKPSPAKTPVVMFIHGGGWNSGDKRVVRQFYRQPILQALLQRGYAVVSINYRLTDSDNVHFPAPVADCQDAIRWVRQHAAAYHFDADNLGVWGASAGAHLALLAAYVPEDAFPGDTGLRAYSARVRYVVDNFGPTDLNTLFRTDAPSVLLAPYKFFFKAKYQRRQTKIIMLTGTDAEHDPQQARERCARYSPITYVSSTSPPTLLFHGDADQTVPLAQSELLDRLLTRRGVAHQLVVYPGAAHGFRTLSQDSLTSMVARTVKFVQQYGQ